MLDLKTIHHLAELSMLSFTDEEIKKLALEMGEIKALMDKVKDNNCLSCCSLVEPVKYKRLRSDRVFKSLDRKKVLSSAKKTNNSGFIVPRVVH